MKGVNKLVIEVKPENEYFEKAILFIKPDKSSSTSQRDLSVSAENLFKNIEKQGSVCKSYTFISILTGAVAGSFITFLISLVIGLVN